MTHPALQSFFDKWLQAHPAQSLALPFVDAARRELYLSLAALEQELVSAAYAITEPGVAAIKLNWWGEELGGAPASGGRHPLTQVLFADEAARAIDAMLWLNPVMAALKQLDTATPADFDAQLEATQAFHGALARLETRVWFGPDADPDKAMRMAVLDHILQATARLKENVSATRLPLPMSRLARHHLDRENLVNDSKDRRQALLAQLEDLDGHWREAWYRPGPLSLFRGLEARLGQRWIRHARRAADPLAGLRHCQKHQTGLATLRRAWASARSVRASR